MSVKVSAIAKNIIKCFTPFQLLTSVKEKRTKALELLCFTLTQLLIGAKG